MRIFMSVGEPSGDIHGANLIRELQRRHPGVEVVGFGGEKMAAAGARLLYPLCDLAVMWFARVLAHAPTFLSLISRADRYLAQHRPDAVVLIDYPGFNFWMARRAHFRGIPVFYFVPPQLWGWAGWRVKKMRRFVDHVLCTLPFEKPWYQARGVEAQYVGHPFFDELPLQRLDQDFMQAQQRAGGPIVGILPGSRTQEIERNFTTQLETALAIQRARPDVRFLAACFRDVHKATIDEHLRDHPELNIHTYVGRTPEIIELSHACVAVSGSVSLELLYRQKPTVVVYRVGKLDLRVAKYFMTTRFICLVNLLAEHELFPEYLVDRCAAPEISAQVLQWLNDGAAYERLVSALAELKQRVAEPGACGRAAECILSALASAPTQAA